MGGCGCGDGFGDWRFPAPDGGWYTLRFYWACSECETPFGIILDHYKTGNDTPITELCDERQWRELDADFATTEVAFLHPRHLRKALAGALVGLTDEIKEGEYDYTGWEEALAEALLENVLDRAVEVTQDDPGWG